MNILLIITTIQAWFFFSLILGVKKHKQVTDYILAVWLLLIGLHTLIYFLMHKGIYNYYGAILNVAIPFLQGPILLFYVTGKSTPARRFTWADSLHFLPFFAFILYQLINSGVLFQEQSSDTRMVFIGLFENYNVFGIFFLVSLPIYLIFSFIRTRSGNTTNTSNLIWIRLLILFVAGIWVSSLLSLLLPELISHQNQIKFNSLIFISLTGFVYFISYFGFKENIFTTDIPKIVAPKYTKSKILDKEANIIWITLQEYMQTEEPYLDPELNLNQLASKLEITPNKLSQLINTKSGLNFYDYINKHRVEKVKRLMVSDKFKHFSLLGLALEAGFNSKATFNRVFKKIENSTPSQYKSNLSV